MPQSSTAPLTTINRQTETCFPSTVECSKPILDAVGGGEIGGRCGSYVVTTLSVGDTVPDMQDSV